MECLNSLYTDSPKTRRRYATNFAYMNPEDIRREGLEEFARISITSPHGYLCTQIKTDKTVPVGVIAMAHQWGEPDPDLDPDGKRGAFTGRLVSLDRNVEAINRMPQQTAIPVRVARS